MNIHCNFYKQVLEYWYHFYCKVPKTVKEVANTDLFDSVYVIIDNKPVYYSSWAKVGIKVIGDILNENGYILQKDQLEQKYHITIKQMDYNCLIHSLPKTMLNIVKGQSYNIAIDVETSVLINCKATCVEKVTCKDIYWEYIREIALLPKSEQKWEKYLGCTINNWQDFYYVPYVSCRETYIQSFQNGMNDDDIPLATTPNTV